MTKLVLQFHLVCLPFVKIKQISLSFRIKQVSHKKSSLLQVHLPLPVRGPLPLPRAASHPPPAFLPARADSTVPAGGAAPAEVRGIIQEPPHEPGPGQLPVGAAAGADGAEDPPAQSEACGADVSG